MSRFPRVVAADITFTWDGGVQRLQRGQILDVRPGSALENAIGADMLQHLHGPPPRPAPARPPADPGPVGATGPDSNGEPESLERAPDPLDPQAARDSTIPPGEPGFPGHSPEEAADSVTSPDEQPETPPPPAVLPAPEPQAAPDKPAAARKGSGPDGHVAPRRPRSKAKAAPAARDDKDGAE